MRYLFSSIAMLILMQNGSAQTKFYTLEQAVPFSVKLNDKIFGERMRFKRINDQVLLLTTSDDSSFNLKSFSLSDNSADPIIDYQFTWKEKHSLQDYFFTKNKLLLIDANDIISIDCKNNQYRKVIHVDRSKDDFRRIMQVDNDKFLVSTLYPYHPYDGPGELLLYIYDDSQRKLTDTLKLAFQGISLSNIINQWVRVVNKNIYIIHPLTGVLFRYDSSLRLIDSTILPISSISGKENYFFVQFMDNAKSKADRKLLDIKEQKGKEYVENNNILSDYYSKDALIKRIDTLRKNYNYIEKLYEYNDTCMLITVYKPGYEFEYRDVYFLDLNNYTITDSIIKWRCGRPGEGIINQIEDYFTVDLINSYYVEPIFYKGKIFTTSSYPIELFKPGTKKEIDDNIFKWSNKNDYKLWTLLQYSIRN